MKRLILLACIVAATAQAQPVYRDGTLYTDKPSPTATRVYIVLNIVDAQPVPFTPRGPGLVSYAAPAQLPAPQVVININVRQPSPYNYGGQRPHYHHPRSYR